LRDCGGQPWARQDRTEHPACPDLVAQGEQYSRHPLRQNSRILGEKARHNGHIFGG
jgi:hypothetical protein